MHSHGKSQAKCLILAAFAYNTYHYKITTAMLEKQDVENPGQSS